MKSMLMLCFVVMTGCSAAFVERMSTDNLWEPNATAPYISEHPVGTMDHFGYGKRLIIHNPLNYPINAKVVCSSMYQADVDGHVQARKQRFYLITASRPYGASCVLVGYEAATE